MAQPSWTRLTGEVCATLWQRIQELPLPSEKRQALLVLLAEKFAVINSYPPLTFFPANHPITKDIHLFIRDIAFIARSCEAYRHVDPMIRTILGEMYA